MRGFGPDASGGERPARSEAEENETAEIVALSNSRVSAVVLIEKRTLVRECLSRCISADFGAPVISFPSVECLHEASAGLKPTLIVVSAFEENNDLLEHAIRGLCSADYNAPIIVLSDAEDIDDVADSLRSGASGHLPTGTALDIAIEAMRLVSLGGLFVPGHSVLRARRQNQDARASDGEKIAFTTRQNAVLDALCRGKTNKLIAYELNMAESTVKVHVRNIMKKLQARNRTEVAVRIGELGARS